MDTNVTEDRCSFLIQEHKDNEIGLYLGWNEITPEVSNAISDLVNDEVKEIKSKHAERISKFIRTQTPKYRRILREKPHLLNKLSFSASTDEIIKVFEVEFQKERAATKKQIQKALEGQEDNFHEIKGNLSTILKRQSQHCKDTLIDYVVDRKAVIEILRKVIRTDDQDSISKEEEVHNIIFPMRETNDSVDYTDHNLWLVDERLCFNRLLSSDLSIGKNFDIKSRKEPDIICYTDESPHTEDNFSSATIVELKRPIKPSHHYNPVDQMMDTIMLLRNGEATSGGRKVHFKKGSSFFGYIISEKDEKTLTALSKFGFRETPDKDGYFLHRDDWNAYIEFITFSKLLKDARQRNYILFEKLGLPI